MLSHDHTSILEQRHRLMVLTTPMVLTKTHGIESVILNHTRTRGPSVTRMRDFGIQLTVLNTCHTLQYSALLGTGV